MLRKKLKLDALEAVSNDDNETVNKSTTTTTAHSDSSSISKYFNLKPIESTATSISSQFLNLELSLNAELRDIAFADPVKYVYNPVEYAFEPHCQFVHKYCTAHKKILFVGMNPGPHGMCQTGVPFGEVNFVKDWLHVEGPVRKPPVECPDRPVFGFACVRSEVSGKRFWQLCSGVSGQPEVFFEHAFVHNYCPLAFLDVNGRNVTPGCVKIEQRRRLETACDATLLQVLKLLNVELLVGIGRYIEKKCSVLVKRQRQELKDTKVLYIPHPSPRAVGTQNWVEDTKKLLRENGVMQHLVHVKH